MEYPDEPWHLRGQLHASAFLAPLADVLAAVPDAVPPGCSPVRLGRRAVLGTAWVSYEPGGVLTYREVMVTLLVRRGRRVLPTILAIWVDSVASRDGGRALWGIPKDLAEFDFGSRVFLARGVTGDGPIAWGTVRPRLRLPGRWPVAFSIAQQRDGDALVSPVHARGRLSLSRASFVASPTGPIGFLAARRPIVSFSLGDFDMSFGHGEGARLA